MAARRKAAKKSRRVSTAQGRRSTGRRSSAAGGEQRPRAARKAGNRWSARVMQTSDALDLEQGVFTKSDPREVARSLKRSAEASRRRKSDAFRSAMSMLNFDINRAGKKLPASRKRVLERAKDELRSLFHRERGNSTSRSRTPQRARGS